MRVTAKQPAADKNKPRRSFQILTCGTFRFANIATQTFVPGKKSSRQRGKNIKQSQAECN